MHALPPGALIPEAATPVLRGLAPACWDCVWDWIATLNISPRFATIAVRASILTVVASAGLVVAGVGLRFVACCGGRAKDIDAVPIKT